MSVSNTSPVSNFKVVLAQEEVLAGQYISGNVQFDVTDDMPFRRIYVDVWGQEEMRVVGEHAQQCCVFSHQTTLSGHDQKDDSSITKSSMRLTSLKRGHYNFPFAVQIPVDAPPTIRDSPTSASAASLTYNATAYVVNEYSTTATSSSSSSQFDVITPQPTEPLLTSALTAMSVTETPQHLCGCFGVGGAHLTCTLSVSNPNLTLQKGGGQGTLVHAKVGINTQYSVVPVEDIILSIRRICTTSVVESSSLSSADNNYIHSPQTHNSIPTTTTTTPIVSHILMFEQLKVSLSAAGGGGEEEVFVKTTLSIPSSYYRRFGPTYHGVLFSQQYELIAINHSDGVVIGVLPLIVADDADAAAADTNNKKTQTISNPTSINNNNTTTDSPHQLDAKHVSMITTTI